MAERGLPHVLVVGGGPAGAALSILLARAGRQVFLLEKTAAPQHKVCGEFLSGEALLYLQNLGVDLHSFGALPIWKVRLAAGNKLAEAKLPFEARSLTRQALDEALLARAVGEGVTVRRGASVDRVHFRDGSWHTLLADGSAVGAPDLFVATGKHDLRGWGRPRGTQGNLVALKMYLELSAGAWEALRDTVEIALVPGGYVGLQPVQGGMGNLTALLNKEQVRRCGGRWELVLAALLQGSSHLQERLAGAMPRLPKPLALSSIPYGWLRRSTQRGLWWLGDQAAVIPSFSGDGMSIALHSAYRAAAAYLGDHSSEHYQRALFHELRGQVWVATTVSRTMVAAPGLVGQAARWTPLVSLAARATRLRAVRSAGGTMALGAELR